MRFARPLGVCAFALALGALSAAPAGARNVNGLQRSRQLWATINVCNPFDQPDMVGVRGSMPGDGEGHDAMFMRFRLQYEQPGTHRWLTLATGGTPTFVAVGSGRSSRQAGRSFQLVPVPGKPAFTLRGVINFQWRHGSSVLASATRVTSAGRQVLAGADPPGFSAATCQIG